MKIQITMESQPKADWKAVISNFQKAWVIWFPSGGNSSTGINLWMVLDNLNKSCSLPASCVTNMWCGLLCSPVFWDWGRIDVVTGKGLSHLTYWGTCQGTDSITSQAGIFWSSLFVCKLSVAPSDMISSLSVIILGKIVESVKWTPPPMISLCAVTLSDFFFSFWPWVHWKIFTNWIAFSLAWGGWL